MPVMTTEVPAPPDVGVNPVIVGGGTVNELLLVAVPPGVVTAIVPDVAPAGTVAAIDVSLFTVYVDAARPWNRTALAPVKCVPLMATEVPGGPLAGVNDVIVGTKRTVKFVLLVAVPPAVVTAIGPVVAPAGTDVEICVLLSIPTVAAVPLNVTPVAPAKLLPVIVTAAPTSPDAGVKPEMSGRTVKSPN